LQPPAAPTELAEWIVFSGTSGAAPVYYKWTAPAGPISGYYLWMVRTYEESSPPPAVCGANPGWKTLPASATTYNIPNVEADAPTTYICAFNNAGMSPVVKFPVVDQAHAPTSGPLELPAAPTWLSSQLNPTDGTYPSEELGWTPPAASIRGYYLNIVFYEAGDLGTPAPEPCGPTWKKLPASATTSTIPAVETPPWSTSAPSTTRVRRLRSCSRSRSGDSCRFFDRAGVRGRRPHTRLLHPMVDAEAESTGAEGTRL
jgi:hypothetical protein